MAQIKKNQRNWRQMTQRHLTLPPSSAQLINSSESGGASFSFSLSGAGARSLSALRLCSQRKKLYFVFSVRREDGRDGPVAAVGESLTLFIVSLYGSL